MKMINNSYICCFLLTIVLSFNIHAQENGRLSKERQTDILVEVCEMLEKYYTSQELGLRLSKTIMSNFLNGKYSGISTSVDFLEKLNKDFFMISNDMHLKLIYDPEKAKEMNLSKSEGGLTNSEIKYEKWVNFGFKELKILDGNIGYMSLSEFCSVNYSGEKAVSVMKYLSDCNSLIIDLRQSGGGSDEMVRFLASYFIDSSEQVLFNISYSTIDSIYYTSISSSYVQGKKLVDIPIYILISNATASAAEAFINIMKNYNRNVITISKKTRGAENPVNHLVVNGEYIFRIPSWRVIYSSINTKWEGIGISPNIEIEPSKAFATAHFLSLKKLMQNTNDKEELDKYQWAYDGVKSQLEPISISEEILKSYEGNYSGKKIHKDNGRLFYGEEKKLLIPISQNYFLVESADYLRIKFIKEKDKIVAIDRVFVYGYSTRHSRK